MVERNKLSEYLIKREELRFQIEQQRIETLDCRETTILLGKMKYCPYCGHPVTLANNGAIVCENCGWEFE